MSNPRGQIHVQMCGSALLTWSVSNLVTSALALGSILFREMELDASCLQVWVTEDEKQTAILNALRTSMAFPCNFTKAKQGEQQADLRVADQVFVEVKLAGGAGDAGVQNMVGCPCSCTFNINAGALDHTSTRGYTEGVCPLLCVIVPAHANG